MWEKPHSLDASSKLRWTEPCSRDSAAQAASSSSFSGAHQLACASDNVIYAAGNFQLASAEN